MGGKEARRFTNLGTILDKEIREKIDYQVTTKSIIMTINNLTGIHMAITTEVKGDITMDREKFEELESREVMNIFWSEGTRIILVIRPYDIKSTMTIDIAIITLLTRAICDIDIHMGKIITITRTIKSL